MLQKCAHDHVQYKKGYLCLESEGAQINFRNLKIMELHPGDYFS